MRWKPIILGIAFLLLSAPVAINPMLRSEYFRVLAHWRAKIETPRYVFIGDSITAGGGVWGWRLGYDPLSAINLGQSGLVTSQVADMATIAARYHPRTVIVMAGMNDAMHSLNREELTRAWDKLFANLDKCQVIVMVPAMTRDPKFNQNLKDIASVVRDVAKTHSAKLIDLNGDLAPEGTIEPRYTVDGVHFTDAAYKIWASKIITLAH